MTPEQMVATLQTLRRALPALESFAAEYQKVAEAITGLKDEVNALSKERDRLKTDLTDGQQAADVAQAKRAHESKAAETVVEERLKDLVRSQKAAEDVLLTTRAEAVSVKIEQERASAEAEDAHEGRIASLRQQERAAAAALAAMQDKVKAFHADLAGMAGR